MNSMNKKIADGITFSRAGIGIVILVLGWLSGAAAIGWIAILMLVDWIGDVLDGAMARRSLIKINTWIGDHDLEIDFFISICLAIYLWKASFLPITYLASYLLIWLIIFLIFGFQRQLAMFFQAPIYLLLIVEAMQRAPWAGWAIIISLLLLIIITWPRFPKQVLPDFFKGVQRTLAKFSRN